MEVFLGILAVALCFAPLILALIYKGKLESLSRRVQQLELSSLLQSGTIEKLQRILGTTMTAIEPPAMNPMQEPSVMSKPSEATTEIKPRQPKEQDSIEIPAPPPPPETAYPSATEPPHSIVQPSESVFNSKTRTSNEWEALIGGKILNRIGAIALIIGVGFFLKYAFDNDLISETLRVILGGLAGGGLLVGAARMHKKSIEIFSQGLVGAGISILYLSVYAAFNFYHLIPQFMAFVLMSGVTMLTLWQALKYDSPAVALLGWAGGFLTPFMLSTGSANEIGLFTYIALLDAGLLAIVLSKEKWSILEPLTVAATYCIYFLWFDSGMDKPEALMPTLFFLTLFWVLFFGVEAFRNFKRSEGSFIVRQLLGIANSLLYYIGVYQLIEPNHHAWMGCATVLIGAPYSVMFLLLRKRGNEPESLLVRYLLSAIMFFFSATAIQFSGFTTVILWSLEACAVVYAGAKWNMKPVWIAAVTMFAFAFFKLLLSDGSLSFVPLEEFRLLFNMRALSYLMLGTMLRASTELFRQRKENLAVSFHAGLSYAGCFIFLVLLTVETNDLFSRWLLYAEGNASEFLVFKRVLTIGMVWMAYSVALCWFGFRRNTRPVLYSSVVTLVLALGMGGLRSIEYDPIEQYSFVLNYRVLTMVFLVAGTIAHGVMWKKYGSTVKNSSRLLNVITIAVVALVFSLITAETYDGFENLLVKATGDVFEMLSFKRVLTLALVWTLYSFALTWIGLKKKYKSVMYCGIAVMVLGLGVGLFRSPWYEPVEWFYPLLNFRFMVLGLLIAGAVLQRKLWRKNGGEVDWSKSLTGAIGLMIVALVLVLVTSETRDYFEKQIHITQRLMGNDWTRELDAQLSGFRNMQQLSLSGVWLCYSIILMGFGIWKRYRNLRLVAIGLFGITILKIFIYDLSFLQTLYRIFSFMGLGVILLGVSYLYQKYKNIILDTEDIAVSADGERKLENVA